MQCSAMQCISVGMVHTTATSLCFELEQPQEHGEIRSQAVICPIKNKHEALCNSRTHHSPGTGGARFRFTITVSDESEHGPASREKARQCHDGSIGMHAWVGPLGPGCHHRSTTTSIIPDNDAGHILQEDRCRDQQVQVHTGVLRRGKEFHHH
jgi:hypothetical protein